MHTTHSPAAAPPSTLHRLYRRFTESIPCSRTHPTSGAVITTSHSFGLPLQECGLENVTLAMDAQTKPSSSRPAKAALHPMVLTIQERPEKLATQPRACMSVPSSKFADQALTHSRGYCFIYDAIAWEQPRCCLCAMEASLGNEWRAAALSMSKLHDSFASARARAMAAARYGVRWLIL